MLSHAPGRRTAPGALAFGGRTMQRKRNRAKTRQQEAEALRRSHEKQARRVQHIVGSSTSPADLADQLRADGWRTLEDLDAEIAAEEAADQAAAKAAPPVAESGGQV